MVSLEEVLENCQASQDKELFAPGTVYVAGGELLTLTGEVLEATIVFNPRTVVVPSVNNHLCCFHQVWRHILTPIPSK